MSISWNSESVTARRCAPPIGREVAADRVVGGEQRGARRRDLELVEIGGEAVAGLHDRGDLR